MSDIAIKSCTAPDSAAIQKQHAEDGNSAVAALKSGESVAVAKRSDAIAVPPPLTADTDQSEKSVVATSAVNKVAGSAANVGRSILTMTPDDIAKMSIHEILASPLFNGQHMECSCNGKTWVEYQHPETRCVDTIAALCLIVPGTIDLIRTKLAGLPPKEVLRMICSDHIGIDCFMNLILLTFERDVTIEDLKQKGCANEILANLISDGVVTLEEAQKIKPRIDELASNPEASADCLERYAKIILNVILALLPPRTEDNGRFYEAIVADSDFERIPEELQLRFLEKAAATESGDSSEAANERGKTYKINLTDEDLQASPPEIRAKLVGENQQNLENDSSLS